MTWNWLISLVNKRVKELEEELEQQKMLVELYRKLDKKRNDMQNKGDLIWRGNVIKEIENLIRYENKPHGDNQINANFLKNFINEIPAVKTHEVFNNTGCQIEKCVIQEENESLRLLLKGYDDNLKSAGERIKELEVELFKGNKSASGSREFTYDELNKKYTELKELSSKALVKQCEMAEEISLLKLKAEKSGYKENNSASGSKKFMREWEDKYNKIHEDLAKECSMVFLDVWIKATNETIDNLNKELSDYKECGKGIGRTGQKITTGREAH